MKKHYRKETDCLNCGTVLVDKFCHHCGQENLQIKENFGHLMNHAISDYFHFDHQFFHTLKPLIFQPGKLTNEYMAGRRVQYLHPIKMYIFISLIYFLLLFKSNNEVVKITESNPAKSEKAIDSLKNIIASNPKLTEKQKKAIQGEIENYGGVKLNNEARTKKADNNNFLGSSKGDTSYQQYVATQQKLPENKKDGFLKRLFQEKYFSYKQKYGERAKEVFIDDFKHNIPKMMFLVLPLYALILKVAFWKNRKFYVEHLIFSFHLHCFLFLFMALIMIMFMIVPLKWQTLIAFINLLGFVGITWYAYRSLRVVYHRSRFRTISKMIGTTLMYSILITFCLASLLVVTALTMA